MITGTGVRYPSVVVIPPILCWMRSEVFQNEFSVDLKKLFDADSTNLLEIR